MFAIPVAIPIVVSILPAKVLTLSSLFSFFASLIENKVPKIETAAQSSPVYAAYASFCDDVKGTLEKDKFADMVVISSDILSSDPSVLLKTKILMTVIRGEVLYENKTPAALNY